MTSKNPLHRILVLFLAIMTNLSIMACSGGDEARVLSGTEKPLQTPEIKISAQTSLSTEIASAVTTPEMPTITPEPNVEVLVEENLPLPVDPPAPEFILRDSDSSY